MISLCLCCTDDSLENGRLTRNTCSLALEGKKRLLEQKGLLLPLLLLLFMMSIHGGLFWYDRGKVMQSRADVANTALKCSSRFCPCIRTAD